MTTQLNPTKPSLKHLLTRVYHFSASHRLYRPDWTDEQNWEIYNKCSYANGHGHNYVLEVTVTGEIDPVTGMMADILEMDDVVDARILKHVDHRHLNLDTPFLQGKIPTAEVLAQSFWEEIVNHMPTGAILYRIRLQETVNNWAEYLG